MNSVSIFIIMLPALSVLRVLKCVLVKHHVFDCLLQNGKWLNVGNLTPRAIIKQWL